MNIPEGKMGKSAGAVHAVENNRVNILFGGDMSFDLELRQSDYCGAWKLKGRNDNTHVVKKENLQISQSGKLRSRITRKMKRIWDAAKIDRKKRELRFQELLLPVPENKERMSKDSNTAHTISFDVNHPPGISKYSFSFQNIKTIFKEKDLVIANLETPLTNHKRPHGLFMCDPEYARAISDAGITVVNLSNNHIFDAGENGFLDTLKYLDAAGVHCIGVGENLSHARAGKVITCNSNRILFMSYTQFCNNKFSSVAADYPGILPLDPQMMIADISAARKKADLVLVNLHWGRENVTTVHPRQVEIAHQLIDAGADAIIGHHPHIPQGIEIYKSRPILYSLGNLIFGQSDVRWKIDNLLAEFTIQNKRIEQVTLHAVSGMGQELYQPFILTGERAGQFFRTLNEISEPFGTRIKVADGIGTIRLT